MSNIRQRAIKGSDVTQAELDANFKRRVTAKIVSYTIDKNDNEDTIEFKGTDLIATLPAVSSITSTSTGSETGEFIVTLHNLDSTALTYTPAGADTIAGVNASKLLGQYKSVTLQTNDAQDGWNILGSAEVAGVQVLDSDNTATTWANTSATQTIYTYSIPANTGAADGMFRLTLLGEYFNSVGTNLFIVSVKLGATSIVNSVVSMTNSGTTRTIKLVVTIPVVSSSVQYGQAFLDIADPASTAQWVADTVSGASYSARNTLAEDLSTALTLLVTIKHPAADANISFIKRSATLEYLP